MQKWIAIVAGAGIGFLVLVAKSSIGTVRLGLLGPVIGAIAGGAVGWLFWVSRNWRRESGFRSKVAYWIMGSTYAAPFILLAGPIGPQEATDPIFWIAMVLGILAVGAAAGFVIRYYVSSLRLE